MTDQLLNAEETAYLLNVTTSWVRRAARNGVIPTVKLGRHIRFRREAVEEFVLRAEINQRKETA